MKRLWPAITTGLLLSTGCAATNPDWLDEPTLALCLDEIDRSCILELALKVAGDDESSGLKVEPQSNLFQFSLGLLKASNMDTQSEPDFASSYYEAGQVVGQLGAKGFSETLELINGIQDEAAQVIALNTLLLVGRAEASEGEETALLNKLYELDKNTYLSAISYKLPELLAKGDFERAAFLRVLLLDELHESSTDFSTLALVAAAYSASGLVNDANQIVVSQVQAGRELSKDDLLLIKITSIAATSGVPTRNEFLYFRDDQARVDAYLTIGTLARYSGDDSMARMAITEGMRFIQKSTIKADTKSAMASFAVLSFGLIY
tara:strand:+ start:13742 stop:14701 length:960 start_codon:yes stop_codon:yes gene_type:complete